ncbi:MAG TPA: hypothetical protein DC038_07165 [Clostridiales bacterium]|nr:hypothetical protein [Clostridiales bacterium]
MNLLTQIWCIVLSVCIIIYLVVNICRQKYSVKFSMPWFLSFLAVIVMSVFPGTIDEIATLLGIHESTNAIFFIAISLLIINIMSMSFSMSETKKKSIRMAQEIALLRKELSGIK